LLTTKLNKLQSSLEEEQQINKCMTSNQNAYLIRLNEMEEKFKKSDKEKTLVNIYSGRNTKNKLFELTFCLKEIEDLKSQLRDVLFYLDAQKQISENDGITNEEIQDSQLHIQQNNDENAASASKGRLRRKKK
jgi:BRCA1-associated protein